jgi:UDP-4-amino-4,6-dideoxy-N-acetyl-beta-L-altrosamine transaminase
MIPYGRQDISEEDIQAVIDVLRSEYLTQGPVVPAFEKAVANYCGASYGIAVNSATSALHIACLALGVGKGDLVWTSPISFVASSNCALYCGASVDFVDIDPVTYNMSIEVLASKLEKAELQGKLPKVVIPVHLAGQSCDMRSIHGLSLRYGFKIIEDASHAIGGRYLDEPIGNCKYSDITVFSFHPVKIITTGEGGMCLTNSYALAVELGRLRSHGIVRHPSEMTHIPDGPWYYQQVCLGFNYRMTDISAALGLSQMSRIDEFVKKRQAVATNYNELLSSENWISLPLQDPETHSAFHLYIIRIKKGNKVAAHLHLFERLRNEGILVNLHYIPIYRQPYYVNMGFSRANFPNAEAYYSEAISIPMYSALSLHEQQKVVENIKAPLGFQNLF